VGRIDSLSGANRLSGRNDPDSCSPTPILVLKELKREGDNVTCDENSKKPIALACCPLIVLKEDQVRRLPAIPSVNTELIGL
jgi:hypothetical protein